MHGLDTRDSMSEYPSPSALILIDGDNLKGLPAAPSLSRHSRRVARAGVLCALAFLAVMKENRPDIIYPFRLRSAYFFPPGIPPAVAQFLAHEMARCS